MTVSKLDYRAPDHGTNTPNIDNASLTLTPYTTTRDEVGLHKNKLGYPDPRNAD